MKAKLKENNPKSNVKKLKSRIRYISAMITITVIGLFVLIAVASTIATILPTLTPVTHNKVTTQEVEVTDTDAQKPKITPVNVMILDSEMQQLSVYIKTRKSNQPTELCNIIAYHTVSIARKNKIPVDIVVGIIEVESLWDIYAKSSVGAKGLMQVYREDGIDIDPDKVYSIEYNIDTGVQILKSKLRKAKGDISLALNYYVGGDKKYQDKVYNFFGRYMLHKISNNDLELKKYEATPNRTTR